MTNVRITATIEATASRYVRHLRGARDYTVVVTVTAANGNDRSVTGGVTIVPDPHNGGRWVGYGDTLDTWVESPLVMVVAGLGRTAAQAIIDACLDGETEVEIDHTPVDVLGAADGVAEVETVRDEQGAHVVQATLAPGHVAWDDSARAAGAATRRKVPEALHEVYYCAFASSARSRAEEIAAERS